MENLRSQWEASQSLSAFPAYFLPHPEDRQIREQGIQMFQNHKNWVPDPPLSFRHDPAGDIYHLSDGLD